MGTAATILSTSRLGLWTGCLFLGVVLAPVAFAKPIIMSPAPLYDFGEADNDQKISHEFIIRNVGDEPLEISDVRTTCGCTVADLKTNTLSPGQETSIAATFDLKAKQGPQHKRITVVSNDPDQPSFGLEIKGIALSTVMVEPSLINFGQIMDSEPHEQKVTIKSAREGHSFEILDVKPVGEVPFDVRLETIVPGQEYVVAAVTQPNMMPGRMAYSISIRTNDTSRPAIVVKVYGQVIGPLQVQPEVIHVQANSAPDARPASINLRVLPGRFKEFELLEAIEPVEGMEAELLKRKDNDYIIKLSNMPVDKSLADKELIVRTNLPEYPELRIPFFIRPERTNPVAVRQPSQVPRERVAGPVRPTRPTGN